MRDERQVPVVYDVPRDFGPGAWEFVGPRGILVTGFVLGPAVGHFANSHVGTSPTFTSLGIGLGSPAADVDA